MKYCAGAPHPVADATWRREKAVRAAVARKGLEIYLLLSSPTLLLLGKPQQDQLAGGVGRQAPR